MAKLTRNQLIAQLLEELDQCDWTILTDLYFKRVLSSKLISKIVFISEGVSDKSLSADERIQRLKSHDLLSFEPMKDGEPAYYLSNLGVWVTKYFINHNSKYQKWFRSRTSSELKMNTFLLNHQMALNKFSYQMTQWAKDQGLAFDYCDQTYAPPLSTSVWTDAVFFLEDQIFLLEMDTCTERVPQLKEKWVHYFSFLNNPNPAYKDKKITVLFILENVTNPYRRRNSVFSSTQAILTPKLNENFDIIVGTPTEILDYLYQNQAQAIQNIQSSLKAQHGFSVRQANFEQLSPLRFDHYICMNMGDSGILTIDDRPQEFLLDIWLDNRCSILYKIEYYNTISHEIEKWAGRQMGYIVVAPNERVIASIASSGKDRIGKNVFFTTADRLIQYDWSKALFKIDSKKNLRHYTTPALTHTIHHRSRLK